MTLTTVRVLVSKSRTSPESDAGGVVAEDVDADRTCAAVDSGEVGDGTGEGYARKEGSEEGESAHIAIETEKVEIGRSNIRFFLLTVWILRRVDNM